MTSSLFFRIADLSETKNLKYRADDLSEILTGQALLASYSSSSQVLALGEAARILLATILAVTAYFGAGHRDFDAAILLDLPF